MASFISTFPIPLATLPCNAMPRRTTSRHNNLFSTAGGPVFSGLRLVQRIDTTEAAERLSFTLPSCYKTSRISCLSIAEQETLKTVQTTIAKQLSIDESTVTPTTKFADLGADSLDTVEIMMALEEKFGVSIGEEGAENISTVQDAADLIEKFGVSIGEEGAENISTVQDAADLIEKVKAAAN